MTKHFLLEIGMEEMPARYVRNAVKQLEHKLTTWLEESKITFGESITYATPRRIAVLLKDVAEKQLDSSEEVKGPSRKIAIDDQGNWSKAALGFARSQGVEADELFFKSVNGVEYIYTKKNSIGSLTEAVLQEGLPDLISSMSFPKNMRWGHYDLKFARPIRWLVCMFGDDVIPLKLANVQADRITRGHRFLGTEIKLHTADEYSSRLKEQYVIADMNERQQLIVDQINSLAGRQDWNIQVRDDLLEEVNFLVEYPTVLFGQFDPGFLSVPQDVLMTSMREHQRYFPVLDHSGNLLPYFVTVRNGNDVSLDQVARGNEKVLRARLADAKFFYEEDQKTSIDTFLAKLRTVVFHEELGTIADKTERIERIAELLSNVCNADEETSANIKRAAQICKFDLVTQMVYEFPELQGVMGEDYARKAGENEAVATAVFEHYLPRYSGEASPRSLAGTIVSIADKIDTIIGCFQIGIIPTGSQDPYALRRQAAGIVQMMLDHQLPFTLTDLVDMALRVHEQARLAKREKEIVSKEVLEFFSLRVKNVLSDQNIRYDVADAAMAAGFAHVSDTVKRAQALMNALNASDFKLAVESYNRVDNIAAKSESTQYDISLFVDPAEHALEQAWRSQHDNYLQQLDRGQMQEALETLSGLREPVTHYFNSVMVMTEDEQIRQNRLSLLCCISEDLRRFADFHKLVWS